MLRFVSLAACAAVSLAAAPFTDAEVQEIVGYFLDNISPSGAHDGFVVASPSDSNPNYYYHWQRDAAITMRTLFVTQSSDDFDSRMQKYVDWITNAQAQTDNNCDVRGEPKFMTDGTPYTGGWCRPQNDGPAQRSTALALYGQWLIEQGRTQYVLDNIMSDTSASSSLGTCNDDGAKTDCGYVGITEQGCLDQGCCWDPVDPNPNNDPWCYNPNSKPVGGGGLIPNDMSYVTNEWQSTGNCDLWEEVSGQLHFFTVMVQQKGFFDSADLADALGFDDLAAAYRSTAYSMNDTISSFSEGSTVKENNARQGDCAVILGSLYGHAESQFPPSSSPIINTAANIRSHWDTYYQINQDDNNAGMGGTLIGRYYNDQYNGCASNGGSQAHAWFLCSNAWADLYYRNGESIGAMLAGEPGSKSFHELINTQTLLAYARHFDFDQPNAAKIVRSYAQGWHGLTRHAKLEAARFVGQALVTSGDGQLNRVHYHSCPCDCRMTEQVCESTGYQIGAEDLTWSYGTFLRAWKARGDAIEGYGLKPFDTFDHSFGLMKLEDQNCGGCDDGCS